LQATVDLRERHATVAMRAELPDVPGYAIEKELGRGAMGVVYKARQTALNRAVALKMIRHAEHADAEERQRFLVEARALARLKHPNIVQIHEVGEHGGLPFFALEYVEGGTLAERIKERPFSAVEAVRLTATLARAVGAAHDAGIVHRDLKPANILLAADGTPKIGDFGLAKQLDAQTLRTQSGAIVGTPAYMAPEQAAGRSKAVGAAADVYALGVLLYEMLAGQVPFRGSMHEVLQQVVDAEPLSLRRLNARVPRDVETICFRCLQKKPEQRYGSARELAEERRGAGLGGPRQMPQAVEPAGPRTAAPHRPRGRVARRRLHRRGANPARRQPRRRPDRLALQGRPRAFRTETLRRDGPFPGRGADRTAGGRVHQRVDPAVRPAGAHQESHSVCDSQQRKPPPGLVSRRDRAGPRLASRTVAVVEHERQPGVRDSGGTSGGHPVARLQP
jgi:tRNA A-37 threonylcarbamoyl transferase component Bud32